MLSASALLTPALIDFGALSTKSLASFNPRPVISLTVLITSIFLSPVLANTTSKYDFSAAASPAAAGAAATATGAAADTPHFSSSIFESSAACNTVRDDN